MIGILTFYWADDYGALLQTYALKCYLEKTSIEKVEIIPYSPVRLSGRYWFFPIIASLNGEKITYHFFHSRFNRNLLHVSVFIKRKRNIRAFRRKYLTRKFPVRRCSKISLEKYSYVFIGSDQVWNPEITVGLDDAYIGNIQRKGTCQFVAYAASFGSDKLPEEYCEKFRDAACHNFYAISLREQSAVPFIENLLGAPAVSVLDPTLLLEKQDWINAGRKIAAQNYILFICTEINEQMLQYLHRLSRTTGKRIIHLTPFVHNYTVSSSEIHDECGPAEYIGYFQNAAYVITNSFHGTVFSIIFEKPFMAFSHSSKNARLKNLLRICNLDSRLIGSEDNLDITKIDDKIDWDMVKENLEKEKQLSFRFIHDIINPVPNNTPEEVIL